MAARTSTSSRAGLPRCRWKLAARLVAAFVVLLTLWSNDAAAQTITLGRIQRYRPDAQGLRTDPDTYDYRNARPWWISYEDCVSNDVLVFPMIVNNARSTVEVWVGNDTCDEKRGNADRGQCWIVASQTARRDMTIEVPVRNVVRQNLANLNVPTNLGPEVCEDSTDEDGQQVTFFFFVEDGGRAVQGSVQRWTGASSQGTGFDLVGPNPPANLSVGIGEDQLTVSFRGLEEDLQLERIGAYCVPANTIVNIPSTADAGAAEPVTGDAGIFEPAGCPTNLLVEGERPNFAAAQRAGIDLECGKANKSAGEVRTGGLANGTTYAIGVAGEDLLGNPGVLSRLECATPNEVEDFFERYKTNGGTGGGGFCTVSPGRARSSFGAIALLGLLLSALRARRARSRS